MKRPERRVSLGGLDAIVVGSLPASTVVVVLHGRLMYATDLAPFAHSLDLDATFVIPDAPIEAEPRGRCWWPSDAEERARRGGPIDLFALDPPGRADARAALGALCREIAEDVPLALVTFLTFPLLAVASVIFRVASAGAYRATREKIANITAYLQETLSGVRVVRSFGQEPRHIERMSELNEENRAANMRTVYLNASYFPAVELLSALGTAVILLYGGYQYGRYAGYRPSWTALTMAGIGIVLVALTIALGG